MFRITRDPSSGSFIQSLAKQWATLHCAIHKQCLSRLCSTNTVPLYTVQYTHTASLDCAVHTQWNSRLCSTQSASLDCAVHTECLSRLCSTHTVPI